MRLIPVILCGGSGTRLRPASTPQRPKPFLPLLHPKKSLFQQTVERVSSASFAPPIIIANRAHAPLVAQQMSDYKALGAVCLFESAKRDTAPAIAVAALWAQRRYGEQARLLVLPSDHAMADEAAFLQAVHALNDGLCDDSLGLLGVVPTRVETGYGYLQAARFGDGRMPYPLLSFTEKPDDARARAYLASGHYFWNSGVFVCPLRALISAYEASAPAILDAARSCLLQAVKGEDGRLELPAAPMENVPSISIDYALMQRASNLLMQPLECGWNDVGSWHGLWRALTDHPHVHLPRCEKPWGYYERVYSGQGVCVKRLWVRPGGKLSLQYHHFRAEQWNVIAGCAHAQCAGNLHKLYMGQSLYVPCGAVHRLENHSDEPLEIIEIQTGEYLQEDDIIRLDDAYGRHLTLPAAAIAAQSVQPTPHKVRA